MVNNRTHKQLHVVSAPANGIHIEARIIYTKVYMHVKCQVIYCIKLPKKMCKSQHFTTVICQKWAEEPEGLFLGRNVFLSEIHYTIQNVYSQPQNKAATAFPP